jgi:hypothetical protein
MPLCPQITNTPVTVTQTADFTVSSVLPVVAATTTQVDAADAAAAEAAAAAAAADAAAAAAAGVAAAAQASATAAQATATAANATATAASAQASSAAAAAGAAQSTANTALANASTAYTAAIGSLQPSANTIVNASNQMTAINGTGITVYSGASATSGARVVLNSAGLAGFNAGGTATFSISASTGAAVFSGSVTGSTITGGTLNIGGNAIIDASGLLTATGATITGEIRGTSGYFGTATNGFSINSTGLVGVGTGTIVGGIISGAQFTNGSTFSVSPTGFMIASNAEITGTIKATAGYFGTLTNGFSINSTGLVGVGTGTIVGGTISGATFINGAGTFSVTSGGVLVASSATITGTINATAGYIGSAANGWNFASNGTLTNSGFSTILYPTTAPGGNANTYAFYSDRGVFGSSLYASSSSQGAITTLGGIQADGRLYTAAGNFVVNTSGNITAVGSIAATGAITTSGNISTSGSGTITAAGALSGANISTAGNLTVSSYIYNPGYQVSTSGGAARINDATTPTARLVAASGSSIRFKKDVVDISTVSALNPKLLLQVPVKAFKYREDYLDAEDERSDVLVPGFIAEELDAIYPVAVDHDAQDRASRWSSDFIVPGMLALIQDLYKEVQTLKGE